MVCGITRASAFQTPQQNLQPNESYQAMLHEAKTLFADQKFELSLQTLERCLAVRQDDPEAFKLVGLNAVRLNKTITAEQAFKSAARLAPNDYLIQFNMGALYYTQSRFLEAEPALEKAVMLKPDYMPAQLFLGLDVEELGNEEKAIKTYRTAITVDEAQSQKSELPYLYLGRLLYRLDRLEEAAQLLRRSTEIQPNSGEAWLLLGKTYKGLGRESESIAALERAAAVDSMSPEAHYLLSRAYLAQHREQDAQKEQERFEALRASEGLKDDGRRKSQ
jgi:Flp pilus assembly protein TadD